MLERVWRQGNLQHCCWEHKLVQPQCRAHSCNRHAESSHGQLFVTPWTAACQASLSLTISQCLSSFMSIASVMPSSHLILWCPLLLPSVFPSIRDFSNESSVHVKWPNYWSFSLASVLPVNIQGWSPCCPGDSHESSPAPQFEDINSLAFCLL